LKPYWIEGIQAYFVSNVDGTHIAETLKKINAEETLFLIASKTFTTQETMTNAHTARDWFLNSGAVESDIAKHFIALSTNGEAVTAFGIDTKNMFEFWDWVGGRYSLWGAIGLSIALTIGFDHFESLLKGAHSADVHFKETEFHHNIPVLMALIGIWYRNFYNAPTEAILPYDQYMHRFAAYFQQGNMESNGKYIDRNRQKVNYETGPIIWGEPGTNGQHSFYQLVHQGRVIPAEFIGFVSSPNPVHLDGEVVSNHDELMSNFFAQPDALAYGKTIDELKAEGVPAHLHTHKEFPGNRPSLTLLFPELTPYSCGQLLSLYEHRVAVQGFMWGINSFDQWGVELGKVLANKVRTQLSTARTSGAAINGFNPSTTFLLQKYLSK